MAALSCKTKREVDGFISTTRGSGHDPDNSTSCITKRKELKPLQFTELPVEIRELIYEQVFELDKPLSGTISADFVLMERRGSRNLLNCFSAVCFTNKQEQVIASRVFIRNLVFRVWSPGCNLNLRKFFDTLPKNVGYGSVTEFRLCSSYAIDDPAWSWEHERPCLDVPLIGSCPNLRTLTFAFRFYERLYVGPTLYADELAKGFQEVFKCKNLSTIHLNLVSGKSVCLKEIGLSIFMGLAKWLQEGFIRRNGKKLVVTIDWKNEEWWVYSWKTSWDLEKPCYSLIQQGYKGSLISSKLGEVGTESGEAVKVLKLTSDDIPTKE